MNVVCRLDAELASTARKSTIPALPPSTGSASAAKTLSEVSGCRARALLAGAGEHLRRDADEHVQAAQDQQREQRREPGVL